MADRTPTVRPTAPRTVVSAALVGAALTWIALQLVLLAGWSLPALGVSAWLPVLLLAAVTGWLAWATRRTVRERPDALDARVAVTRLQLGKASIVAGACLGAAYLVLAAMAAGGWPAPLAEGRVVHGLLAGVLCAAWAGAGLLLERACRIPDDDDDKDDSEES